MGWEDVADQLYGLRPEEFTAARDEAAKRAPRGQAATIRALKRPTLAAWAVNLLVRSDRDQVAALLGLGEQLRNAHRDLQGGQLRELSQQQRRLVTALSRQTQQLTAEAGRPVGESVLREVEATVHAALADPETGQELAAGRLTKALAPPAGFGLPTGAAGGADGESVTTEATVHQLRPRAGAARGRRPAESRPSGRKRPRDHEGADGRSASVTRLSQRAEQNKRAERERLERLAEARERADELDGAALESETDAATADEEFADARARREDAEERARRLEDELRVARTELSDAKEAERAARDQARRRRKTADRDREQADEAATQAEHIESQAPHRGGRRTR